MGEDGRELERRKEDGRGCKHGAVLYTLAVCRPSQITPVWTIFIDISFLTSK